MSITQKATLITTDSTEYFEVNIRSNKSSKYKQKKFAMKVLSETLEIEFSDEWLNVLNLNPKKDNFQRAIDFKISAEDLGLTVINYRHKQVKNYGKNDFFGTPVFASQGAKNNKKIRDTYKPVFNNYLSILPEDKHFTFELGDKGYKPKNEVIDLYFDQIKEGVFKVNWVDSDIEINADKSFAVKYHIAGNVAASSLHYLINNSHSDDKFYNLYWIEETRNIFFNSFLSFKESLIVKIPSQIINSISNRNNQFTQYTNLYNKIRDCEYLLNPDCNLIIHSYDVVDNIYYVYVYKQSDIVKLYMKFKKVGDINKSFTKMEFTKYIKDYYTNIPDYDIEQFKRTCENGIAIDYVIKTGKDIEKVYGTSNIYKQTGSLGNSCMNDGKQCHNERTKKTDFYCDNENISIVAGYIEGTEILMSRALLWTTVEGEKVMDRIYSIDETTTVHAAEWAKKQGFLNIYDYRKFGGCGARTYYNTSPGNWKDEYDKDFVVQLSTPIVNERDIEAIKNTYTTTNNDARRIINVNAAKLPYLDNFNVFNLEKNLVSNSTSILEGLVAQKTKLQAIDGNYYYENELIIGFTGNHVHEAYCEQVEVRIIDQNEILNWNSFILPVNTTMSCQLSPTIGDTNKFLRIGRTNSGTNVSQFADLIAFNDTIVDYLIYSLDKITENSIEQLEYYFEVIRDSIYNNRNIPTRIQNLEGEGVNVGDVINVVYDNLDILKQRFKTHNSRISLMDALSADNIIGYRKGIKQESNETLEIVE